MYHKKTLSTKLKVKLWEKLFVAYRENNRVL